MHQNCQECTRLWSEYALVTRHFLKLEGRVKIAELSQDRQTLSDLAPQLETATRERSDLRRQIQDHEGAPIADAANA